MDDVFGPSAIALSYFGHTCLAAAQDATLVNQVRSSRAMYGSVHAPATEQRRIGCIDDDIDIALGDVAGRNEPIYFRFVEHSKVVETWPNIRNWGTNRPPRFLQGRCRVFIESSAQGQPWMLVGYQGVRFVLRRASILTAALAACAGQAAAQPSNAPQTDLGVRVGDTVAIIINDQPVRFRLAPDAISVPTVNADVAQKIGLKPSMINYVYNIGTVKISLRTDNVKYRVGGKSFKSRTAFSDRQVVDGADGVAGPETFPFRRTIFTLRDPQAGDRAITLPLDKAMGRSQTSVKIDVGGRPVYVAFSFARTQSVVTATGGQWIADANGGRFNGAAREAPILYGISRPIRRLDLDRPLLLGALEIRNLAVRVADMGSAKNIPDAAMPDQDLDEIVVTAESKRKVPSQRLYIGMDTIGHCASLTYDFAAGTVTLMCPKQPATQATG
jgi:hypothetical protein